jgi:hypothetical protein
MGTAPLERIGVKIALSCLSVLVAAAAPADSGPSNTSEDGPTVIVVVGAAGEEGFGKDFEKWSGIWEAASGRAGAKYVVFGLGETNKTPDLERLKQKLSAEPKESASELWLVLIGHGTFDGKEARFNLRGPDLSASELAEWLKPFRRRIVVINSASSSGPFIKNLSAAGRVVIAATRSGYEQNYARFGQYISESIGDANADLDKDGQVSLLEAFLTASRRVAEFYEAEGRLATEHALLDDNGDGLGTPADWFRGIRAVKKASDGTSLDGLRAHQFHLVKSEQEQKLSPGVRVKRDEIELSIARLREEKSRMDEEKYYDQLEGLLLELAKLYADGASPP